jgi:hypothetical protein
MHLRLACVLVWVSVVGMMGADGPRPLEIDFIDVNGGAATLVVTPSGESILIDSGWAGFDDRDPKRIEHVLKDVAGRDHLDHLITTHWHADHFGGVEGLAKRVRVDHYWDRGLPEDGSPVGGPGNFPDGPRPGDKLGDAYRRVTLGKRSVLRAGDRLPLKPGVEAIVLASGGEVIPAPPGAQPNPLKTSAEPDQAVDRSDNARSLALKFSLGKFDFLDCGDLTWNVEKALVVPFDRVGPVDLFQVTHHGMDISNYPTLVRTIAPIVAIMNNGPRKGGSPATVALLRSIPSIQAAYQLHKNAGTGADQNTDPKLIANADMAGGQFIRVLVEPGGGKFSVQIGAEGAKREFATH